MEDENLIRHTYNGEEVILEIIDEPLLEFSLNVTPELISEKIIAHDIKRFSVVENYRTNDVIFEPSSDLGLIENIKNDEFVEKECLIYRDPKTNSLHKGVHSIIIQVNFFINPEILASLTYSTIDNIEGYDNFYLISYPDDGTTNEVFRKIDGFHKAGYDQYEWINTIEVNVANFDRIPKTEIHGDVSVNEHEQVESPEAYEYINADSLIQPNNPIGKTDIVIALLDSGVYGQHEDLKQILSIKSFDFISGKYGSYHQKEDRHGTCCAGLLAAYRKNKRKGFVGLAFGCTVLDYRIRFNATKKDNYHIVKALLRASLEEGAKVISCSWNLGSPSSAIRAAILRVIENGTTVVFSAGNEGCYHQFPANMKEVITVTGVKNDGEPKYSGKPCPDTVNQWETNFGDECDIAAPGEQITTTDTPNYDIDGSRRYGFFSGTSAAAPLVAACVGLIYSINPSILPCDVKKILKRNAIPFKNCYDQNFGSGLLNVKDSLTDELIHLNI